MLMSSEDQTDKLKGNQLLREIIVKIILIREALSLLAFSYFEGEDYKMAAVTWAMMLRLLEPDDPRVPMLERVFVQHVMLLLYRKKKKQKASHRRNNETSIIRFSPYCDYCFELCTFEDIFIWIF